MHLRLQPLSQLLIDWEKFRSLSITDASSFAHINELIKWSSRMNWSTVVDTIAEERAERGQQGADCARSKRRRGGDSKWRSSAREKAVLGTEGDYLVSDGAYLSVEELLRAIESRKKGLSVRNLYGWMLIKQWKKEVLRFFAKRMRK